jgi:cytochrome c-type biogenesis protein CcmH/NrfF
MLSMRAGLSIILIFSLAHPLWANTDFIDEDRINEVAKDLRCPTCQGLSVAESSAGFAEDIKKNIRLQMEQGKANEEIIQYFRERYGLWILREPPKEGVGLIAWAAPLILLILGPIVVWLATFRQSKKLDSKLRTREEIVAEFRQRVGAR